MAIPCSTELLRHLAGLAERGDGGAQAELDWHYRSELSQAAGGQPPTARLTRALWRALLCYEPGDGGEREQFVRDWLALEAEEIARERAWDGS